MQCPNCFQQTEQGKFCTNCGALIPQDESAVSAESSVEPVESKQGTTEQQTEEPKQTNDAAEKLKETSANFGHFFLTLVKKPSDAQRANGNDFVSAIISIILYSLLFALGYYLTVDSILGTFMGNFSDDPFGNPSSSQSIPFTDGFLWPFLKFIVLFAAIIALTYVGLKLTASEYSFLSTVAKYGGYLIPFLLLLVLGSILTLIGLYSIGITIISVSVFGALLLIPTFILLDQPSLGIDRIYLLIAIYILNILAAGLIMQSITTSILQLLNPFGGMLGQ